MPIVNEKTAIKNFVVFQDLLFHSIMLDVQHCPRIIAQQIRAHWHLPTEKALYAYIHYELSKLSFVKRMDLLVLLRQIILRTSLFHLQRLEKVFSQHDNLFLNLLCTELNVILSKYENFNQVIRTFNQGFILLETQAIYQSASLTEENIATWTNWYYLGLKEFLYVNLACKKTKETELLFTASFLKHYSSIATKTESLDQIIDLKKQELLRLTEETDFQKFALLL